MLALSINEIARHSRLFLLTLSFFYFCSWYTDQLPIRMSLVSCILFVCLFCPYIAWPWGFIFITAGPALAGAFRECDECRYLPTLTEKTARKEGWRPPSFFFGGGRVVSKCQESVMPYSKRRNRNAPGVSRLASDSSRGNLPQVLTTY